MKISDVEYRGDGRKATFYYTAEGRVDFRELVRLYAKEFQVKVEMRQIGARQESSRIGGIGSCGRELCCSTWLTDFKTVNTHAARYQNLSINQAKLSGQCGRLKCCLNYELDTYMEAIEEFPQDVDVLKFRGGSASLIKMDIFKRLLYYSVEVEKGRSVMMALPLERVRIVKDMNMHGQFPEQLPDPKDMVAVEEELDFAQDSGTIELPDYKKKRKKNKKKGPQKGSDKDTTKASGQQQPAQRRDQQRGPNQPSRPRPADGETKPRSDERKPQFRDGQQKPQQGPRPPQQKQEPREPRKEGEVPPQQSAGPKRNKNRNRNRNRKPGGERPPQNPPTA